MRSFLFLLMTVAFSITTHAQAKTDSKQMGLKGKVKSVKLLENYRYKEQGKFTNWGVLYNRQYNFDNTGRYTEFIENKADGSFYYKTVYTYLPKEKKAEISYVYNEGQKASRKIWSYNAKAQKTEEQEYTKDGVKSWRYTYAYDDKGNMTVMTGYRHDGTMSSKTTWTYDAKGNMLTYLVETPGYANSSRKYVYDNKGNMKEEIWYNGEDEVEFRFVRSYDAQGSVVEELKYRGMDDLRDKTTWQFVYDSKGNWTKRTQFTSDGVDFSIAERTISYY